MSLKPFYSKPHSLEDLTADPVHGIVRDASTFADTIGFVKWCQTQAELAEYSMVSQPFHNSLTNRALLAIIAYGFLFCCACASPQEPGSLAQQPSVAANGTFEISGQVTSKSDDRFEVKTEDGKTFEILVSESTDFALRMASPWFDVETREVVVDGKALKNNKRERIKYPLPEGKLYLLAEYRSVLQRDRLMKKTPWRINNYLISDQEIEAVLPKGEGLLLAGELDLENSALIIDGKSWPIMLGFRGATLRGRYFEDIIAGETFVVVSGPEKDKNKAADTVIFMIR